MKGPRLDFHAEREPAHPKTTFFSSFIQLQYPHVRRRRVVCRNSKKQVTQTTSAEVPVLHTTDRVYAGQFFAVGVGVMLPILLLLVPLLHYGEGLRWPNFPRWCRRYAAHFTAVGAAFTLRIGSMLAKFSPLVQALGCCFSCCWCRFITTARLNAAQIFLRGCRRYAAPNVLLVFGAGTDVYAVARRGLCLVL